MRRCWDGYLRLARFFILACVLGLVFLVFHALDVLWFEQPIRWGIVGWCLVFVMAGTLSLLTRVHR